MTYYLKSLFFIYKNFLRDNLQGQVTIFFSFNNGGVWASLCAPRLFHRVPAASHLPQILGTLKAQVHTCEEITLYFLSLLEFGPWYPGFAPTSLTTWPHSWVRSSYNFSLSISLDVW